MDIEASKMALVKLILNIDNDRFIQKVTDFINEEKSDFRSENNVVFYPNPTTGEVNISAATATKEQYNLRILDANGRTVNVLTAISLPYSHPALAKLPNGIYYFQLMDEKQTILLEEKIVKTQ